MRSDQNNSTRGRFIVREDGTIFSEPDVTPTENVNETLPAVTSEVSITSNRLSRAIVTGAAALVAAAVTPAIAPIAAPVIIPAAAAIVSPVVTFPVTAVVTATTAAIVSYFFPSTTIVTQDGRAIMNAIQNPALNTQQGNRNQQPTTGGISR
jgi:hypothetical protein